MRAKKNKNQSLFRSGEAGGVVIVVVVGEEVEEVVLEAMGNDFRLEDDDIFTLGFIGGRCIRCSICSWYWRGKTVVVAVVVVLLSP